MKKKLMRSREHRVVSGVMGGLAEYFNTDTALLRVIMVVFVLATGIFPGVIGYIVAAFIIPEAPYIAPSKPIVDDDSAV